MQRRKDTVKLRGFTKIVPGMILIRS